MKYWWRRKDANAVDFEKYKQPREEVEKIPREKEGIRRSFKQAIIGDNLIVLFRSRTADKNGFAGGKFAWIKGSNELAWSENQGKNRITWTAIFGEGDADADADEAAVEKLRN